MKNSRLDTLAGYAILLAFALATIVPFISVVLTSLQPPNTLVSGFEIPSRLTFDNFRLAWTTAGFSQLFKSSGLVVAGVVPISLVCATLAGYALAVLPVPGRRIAFAVFVIGLTLPVEVIVLPIYFDLRAVGLTNSYWAVILAEAGQFMPFGVLWMRTHFQSLPDELVEAARLDGATSQSILRHVLLPLSAPALLSLSVLYFIWCWNQFLLVLILIQDPAKRTAPAGLGLFVGQFTNNIPGLCAATVLVIVPVVVVYVLLQRRFIAGFLQGSVKS